ncbi:MAG: hypothetical protein B6244_11260 [Candidatus Cloacimonetes bacterium 4572_55]|nr:MAG: hypothetical protein B6244_11260 [Candidatus Cloacimonetes bacterium 4572_55]
MRCSVVSPRKDPFFLNFFGWYDKKDSLKEEDKRSIIEEASDILETYPESDDIKTRSRRFCGYLLYWHAIADDIDDPEHIKICKEWMWICYHGASEQRYRFIFNYINNGRENKKKDTDSWITPENEMKFILFENGTPDLGKLRTFFSTLGDIYLPILKDWFLMHYDLDTASTLYLAYSSKEKNKTFIQKIPSFICSFFQKIYSYIIPRLLACTLVGYATLLTADSMYGGFAGHLVDGHLVDARYLFDDCLNECQRYIVREALPLSLIWLVSIAASYRLLKSETQKFSMGNKKLWKEKFHPRLMHVLCIGSLQSLLICISIFFFSGFIGIVSDWEINGQQVGAFRVLAAALLAVYAPVSLLLGILIQNIWQDKPVTEPL